MATGPSIRLLSAFLVVFVAALAFWVHDVELNSYEDGGCAVGPLCSTQHSLVGKFKCFIFRYPIDLGRSDYKQEVLSRLARLFQRNVKGQRHVVEPVMKDITLKLANPDKALVLHFAGDNGVGKTTLAQMISLALGLRCRDPACTLGDSTLVLSGVSYDGYSVAEFRRDVVKKVVQHARDFPGNGVVIINDLGGLHPDLVRVLLPLLGRASSFPEASGTLLSRLTVIITTDFGREGRTQGKSLAEMRRIVEDDFKSLYSSLSSSMIHTYPFLPISLTTAGEIVRLNIDNYRCKSKELIKGISVSDDVVAWLIESVRDDLPTENGRCVSNAVMATVGLGILQHLRNGHPDPMLLLVDMDDNGSVTVFPATK